MKENLFSTIVRSSCSFLRVHYILGMMIVFFAFSACVPDSETDLGANNLSDSSIKNKGDLPPLHSPNTKTIQNLKNTTQSELNKGNDVKIYTDKKLSYPYNVVATTGFVADLVESIVGDYAKVYRIMGSGVDPHTYTPTRLDIVNIYYSDMVIYSGLHLEGGMYNVFNRIKNRRNIVAIGDMVQVEELHLEDASEEKNKKGREDPHIWMDVTIWQEAAEQLGALFAALDEEHSEIYLENAQHYKADLVDLDVYMRSVFATLPRERRVLITSHDAFQYFGREYGFDVYGIQGISTVSEASLKHISNLIDIIIARDVNAIFVESSVSPKYVQALIEGARSHGYQLHEGGTLFADSMGVEGSLKDNYIGMMRYNSRRITQALGGKIDE